MSLASAYHELRRSIIFTRPCLSSQQGDFEPIAVRDMTHSFPASFGLTRGKLEKRRVLAQCQLSIVWHSYRHRHRILGYTAHLLMTVV